MSQNYVDYEILAQAQSTYSRKAEELQSLLNEIVSMNNTLYPGGWNNLTAQAFVNRFDSDHKVAIEAVIESLMEISNYISRYSANRQEEDSAGASAI